MLEFEGRPIVAMELVEGQPLLDVTGDWSFDARLRLLETLVAIVSAAHQRGIVHRDLKPSNILVDGEGRPKVLDFGIAAALGEAARAAGTLAYAAPEQLQGHPVDARVDVYSLGVLGWELLVGERPHGRAKSAKDWLTAKATLPERPRGLSRALTAVLHRALAYEADGRYGEVASFGEDLRRARVHLPVAALAGDRGHWIASHLRRVGPALLGAGAAVGLGVAGATALREPAAPPEVDACAHVEVALSEVWNPKARERVSAALEPSAAPRVVEGVDRYTEQWREVASASCAGSLGESEAAARWAQARERCLDLRLASARAFVEAVGASEPGSRTGVEVLGVLEQLPSVERCTDTAYLDAALPLPEDPELEPLVHDLRTELTSLGTHIELEGYADAEAALDGLRARAQLLDYRPLDAELGILAGHAAFGLERFEDADAAFRQAFLDGASTGHVHVMRVAGVGRIWSMTRLELAPELVREWVAIVEALHGEEQGEGDEVDRTGLAERAQLHCALYMAESRSSKLEAALDHAQRCYEARAELHGDQGPTVANCLGNLARAHLQLGHWEEAVRVAKRGLEMMRAAGIERANSMLMMLTTLAIAYDQTGEVEAQRGLVDELSVMAEALHEPDSVRFADHLSYVAQFRSNAGNYADAARDLERALAIHQAAFGERHIRVALDQMTLGGALCSMGDREAALEQFARGLDYFETEGTDRAVHATGLSWRGLCHGEHDDHPAALADYVEARALMAQATGEGNLRLLDFDYLVAQARHAAGDHPGAARGFGALIEAIEASEGHDPNDATLVGAHVERALALASSGRVDDARAALDAAPSLAEGSDVQTRADVDFNRAKVLRLIDDEDAARTLAEGTLAELDGASDPLAAELRGEVQAWLDER